MVASPLVASDVTKAVRIVREQFAFVGLLEQWQASVCVFHATLMRGVPINSTAELALTHPGPRRPLLHSHARPADYDEGPLRGFVDAADERVYAAARARFWADARRSGCVTQQTSG